MRVCVCVCWVSVVSLFHGMLIWFDLVWFYGISTILVDAKSIFIHINSFISNCAF